ncbi:hypothetical protein [Microbacterium deminutum]|uniref:Uncharacterized protein n=1 Tax=Microbacterium deminutum TaxID=344164 RepID=A0ABN2RDN7_9MICO
MESYSVHPATPEGHVYGNEWSVYPDGMASVTDGPTLYDGDQFAGMMAFIVPEAKQTFLLENSGQYLSIAEYSAPAPTDAGRSVWRRHLPCFGTHLDPIAAEAVHHE